MNEEKRDSQTKEIYRAIIGITEDLITALSRVEGLRVTARTSAFAFKGKSEDIRKIGAALNVATVLEGSVRKVGNRLRITAQFIDAANGFHIWSGRYDREMEDVFAIQDEISRALVEALKITLVGERKSSLVKAQTGNLDAYQLFLLGRYHWGKLTLEGFKKSIDYFGQAIGLDSSYALAYAWLAYAHFAGTITGCFRSKDALPKAKSAAEAALKIDEQLAAAHAALGAVKGSLEKDWAGYESEMKIALALNPNDAVAHELYSFYLTAAGRLSEALSEIERARQIDPLALDINWHLGTVYYNRREYERATAQFLRAIELDPSFVGAHWSLGRTHLQQGKTLEAAAEFDLAKGLSGNMPFWLARLGHAYGLIDHREKAKTILLDLQDMRVIEHVEPYWRALAHLGAGEIDTAFAWLHRAIDEGEFWIIFLNVDPAFEQVRSDGRFADLFQKMNLHI